MPMQTGKHREAVSQQNKDAQGAVSQENRDPKGHIRQVAAGRGSTSRHQPAGTSQPAQARGGRYETRRGLSARSPSTVHPRTCAARRCMTHSYSGWTSTCGRQADKHGQGRNSGRRLSAGNGLVHWQNGQLADGVQPNCAITPPLASHLHAGVHGRPHIRPDHRHQLLAHTQRLSRHLHVGGGMGQVGGWCADEMQRRQMRSANPAAS